MPSDQRETIATGAFAGPVSIFTPAMDYMIDAAQRGVLFWDVMRQRGNQYREHLAETVPHVLDYEVELVIDGRTLDRPVNYALARVVPPAGIELDRSGGRSLLSTRAPATARASAASRLTAKLALPSRRAIPAISLAFCQTPCPAKLSKISRGPRRYSSKRSLLCILKQTASPALLATARPAGP